MKPAESSRPLALEIGVISRVGEHPQFIKTLVESNVSGGFWLTLLADFSKTFFRKDEDVLLWDEHGKSWPAKYKHDRHALSGGWRKFSIDHNLQCGDIVTFELIRRTEFKISIKRVENPDPTLEERVKETVKETRMMIEELRASLRASMDEMTGGR
ncbi:hypothetical protein R1sor_007685 [Riccia sorocarpa]|uniref:TF-B3 domain-containing protein n=1 Tax=Riccia sorocarpa TaxID=122646 RepID=A0ABD3HUL7_9MARC